MVNISIALNNIKGKMARKKKKGFKVGIEELGMILVAVVLLVVFREQASTLLSTLISTVFTKVTELFK